MISEFAKEQVFLKFIEDNDLEITSELSSTDMYCAYGLKKKAESFFNKKILPTDFYVCFMYNLRGDNQFSFLGGNNNESDYIDIVISEDNFIEKLKETLSSRLKYRNWIYKWDLSKD